jgi:hypothetical protein
LRAEKNFFTGGAGEKITEICFSAAAEKFCEAFFGEGPSAFPGGK